MSKWPPNYLVCDQNTAEWFDARCGLVTASRVAEVMSINKSGPLKGISSQAREDYKMELLTETLTGVPVEHYVSPAMDYGIQNEPVARAQYELSRSVDVARIGFCFHPRIKRAGASPDGLVGDDGLVEIKCPNSATHLQYVLADVVPEEYQPQMLWQMACAERDYCDFVSYDPRLPEDFSLFVKRLERDEDRIRKMEAEVERFVGEINAMADRLLKGRTLSKPGPGPEVAEIPEWEEAT